MSKFEVKMPKLGESITEGTIISWSVKVGDAVEEDQTLFEVTTAKVNAEIPSPVSGKVHEILFNEGDTVPVGVTVLTIDTEEEGETPEENNQQENAAQTKSVKEAEPVQQTITKAANKSERDEESRWYSPVVLQLANEAHIPTEELDNIPGSGYLGRLSKKDIQQYIRNKKNGVEVSKPVETTAPTTQPKPQQMPQVPQVIPMTAGEDQIIEMDPVRRIIADHMVMSKRTSPHVTTVLEVDVTKLVNWRKRTKDEFKQKEGINLTYLPAITEAVAKALKEFPQVNASVDEHKMILKKHINIGIAVALDSGNLVVPVIHDADMLNTKGLAVAIDSLAKTARANKLKVNDVQDGTFSITNFGTFKGLMGTPIINQPQVAILGVGYIEKKPAVIETPEGDMIAIRHKMYLSLSYDHRIIDGTLGGKFLYRIAEYLENWDK